MTLIGAVHGRFQPFHRGHLEYVLAAMDRCEHLLIGITQFDRDIKDVRSPEHRLLVSDNPFSYWERTLLITSALMALKVSSDRYSFVPFPIHEPGRIGEFVPSTATMFTTIYDEWNEEKVHRLESEGYTVEILWRRPAKEFEGKVVRACIRENCEELREMVPVGTYEALTRLLSMKERGTI